MAIIAGLEPRQKDAAGRALKKTLRPAVQRVLVREVQVAYRVAGQRLTGDDVVRVLEQVTAQRGKPQSIRVDNGPEFISRSLDLWAYFNGVKLDFSRPGRPTDNAFIESFRIARDSAPCPFCTASDRGSITTCTCMCARPTASSCQPVTGRRPVARRPTGESSCRATFDRAIFQATDRRAARHRYPQPLTAFHATVPTAREKGGFKTGSSRRDKSGLEHGEEAPRHLNDRVASSPTSFGSCSS